MSHNTKSRFDELARHAAGLAQSVPGLDDLDQENRLLQLRRLARRMVQDTGCTLETARRHLARAQRRERHVQTLVWGGKRSGAGRKFAVQQEFEAWLGEGGQGLVMEKGGILGAWLADGNEFIPFADLAYDDGRGFHRKGASDAA